MGLPQRMTTMSTPPKIKTNEISWRIREDEQSNIGWSMWIGESRFPFRLEHSSCKYYLYNFQFKLPIKLSTYTRVISILCIDFTLTKFKAATKLFARSASSNAQTRWKSSWNKKNYYPRYLVLNIISHSAALLHFLPIESNNNKKSKNWRHWSAHAFEAALPTHGELLFD